MLYTNFLPPCASTVVQRGRRIVGGRVGFGRATQGRAGGEAGVGGRGQNSQFGGSAEEERAAVSSVGGEHNARARCITNTTAVEMLLLLLTEWPFRIHTAVQRCAAAMLRL